MCIPSIQYCLDQSSLRHTGHGNIQMLWVHSSCRHTVDCSCSWSLHIDKFDSTTRTWLSAISTALHWPRPQDGTYVIYLFIMLPSLLKLCIKYANAQKQQINHVTIKIYKHFNKIMLSDKWSRNETLRFWHICGPVPQQRRSPSTSQTGSQNPPAKTSFISAYIYWHISLFSE